MSEAPTTHPQLIVLSGEHKGDVIILNDPMPVVFGQRTGIAFPEPALAPVHCQVFQADGRWYVQDFGSAAGTFLGDERVRGVQPLEFGRSFRVGETHVALHLPDPQEPASVDAVRHSERMLRAAASLPEEQTQLGLSRPKKRRKKKRVLDTTDVFQIELPQAEDPPLDSSAEEVAVAAEPVRSLEPHDTLGDYDILDRLGEGSLGKVYRGYDRRRRRVVALKVLDHQLAQDPQIVARFLRGAKAGARLSHRHIVGILAAGHASGRIYVTMEYVDGLNLEQFCFASGGRLTARATVAIMHGITEALVYAHSRGVVHRNISPRNILIGPGGFPMLADLALAKKTSQRYDMSITNAGDVLVQSPYTPPEAVIGASKLDERSDVYGLAASMFRALTGRPPYGENLARVTIRIVRGQIADARKHARDASPALIGLLARCLEMNPKDRPSHVRDLREAISDLPELG